MPEVRDILINKRHAAPDFRSAAELDKLQRKELAYWAPDDQGDRLHARAVVIPNQEPHTMSLNGYAYIVGAYEHPTRKADELSVVRLHADVARGALADAGLSKDDIDGYFCAGDAPGLGAATMAEYLGLKLRHVDSTECGGSAPILHVAHAAEAIAAGRCNVALITLAGRPRAQMAPRRPRRRRRRWLTADPDAPELAFELPYGPATQNLYAARGQAPHA